MSVSIPSASEQPQAPLVMVSADGHAAAKPEQYREYLEPEHRELIEQLLEDEREFLALTSPVSVEDDEVLALVDDRMAIRSGGRDGGWDLDRRLTEMDREGVAADILLPGSGYNMLPFFHHINRPCSPQLRTAGARAYHRWLADMLAASGGRLYGIGDPGPCLDLDATIAELTWMADHRFVGVGPPGILEDASLPPLWDRSFDPFWAACVDLGLAVTAHAGFGLHQGKHLASMRLAKRLANLSPGRFVSMVADVLASDALALIDAKARRLTWQLMLGGVFDRHPGLKLVLTEIRADWVPETLRRLEERFQQADLKLKHSPSDYFARNVRLTPSSIHRSEIELREEIGVDQLLLGIDYPHVEGMWPNVVDWLRVALAGVPEHDALKFLSGNAIETYGLDAGELERIAARIGPRRDQVLGEHHVSRHKIDHFHKRSGYLKPAEKVDLAALDAMISADLKATGQARA